MKQRTSIALHVAALAALSVAAGCQSIQPRGQHGSFFGGKNKTPPTEGDVVEPGATEIRTKPASPATPETSVPVITPTATPAQAPAKPQQKVADFSIPVDDTTVSKKPVLAKDIKTDAFPKPVSDAEPMRTPVPTQMPGAPALPAIVKKYTVAQGDTFGGIAQKHGLTTSELARVNSIKDINKVRVGQTLNIPAADPKAAKPAAPKKSGLTPPAGGSVYTVKAGDYIGKIAHQHGLKTGDVLRANNLTDETAKKIKVGQQLIIPAKNASNAFKAPDKPAAAPAKDTKPVAIPAPAQPVQTQPATPVTPKPVQITPVTPKPVAPATPAVPVAPAPVVVPATPAPAPVVDVPAVPAVPATPAPSAPELTVPVLNVPATPSQARTYTVQPGEDIVLVAKKHNTTKMTLINLNGFSIDTELTPGQVIKVP